MVSLTKAPLLLPIFFAFFSIALGKGNLEKQTINLWENVQTHHGGKTTLTPYLPADSNRKHPAIIVCPGGSYFWLDMETEGTNVAKWLQENGIAAFVLHYRTAGVLAFITHGRLIVRGHRHPDMIQDAQRAIQYVREHCTELHVDSTKVGVMGFSAGGHLAAMTAEYSNTNFLALVNIHPTVSLKPNFVASIYPVVSFTDKSVHKRSRRALLGENRKRSRSMCDSLSLELHVYPTMPPVFLVNCKDDPIVKYHNSELLDSALTANNVRHRYIQFGTGGHGFGVTPEKTSVEAIGWKDEFLLWLDKLLDTDIAMKNAAGKRNTPN